MVYPFVPNVGTISLKPFNHGGGACLGDSVSSAKVTFFSLPLLRYPLRARLCSPRGPVTIRTATTMPLLYESKRDRVASKRASGKGTVSQDGDAFFMSVIDKVEDPPSEARADSLLVPVACSSRRSQTCDGLSKYLRMIWPRCP
jgi:hypothetical protein